MDTDVSQDVVQSRLEVLWALVLLQGGILVVTTLEALVVNIGFGFLLAGNLVATGAAATLTLMAARGLRRRSRWARRVTIAGEWFVLVVAVVDLLLTLFLAQTLPGLVPLVVTVAVPVTVLVLLRRSKSAFVPARTVPTVVAPTDDPILGTLVS